MKMKIICIGGLLILLSVITLSFEEKKQALPSEIIMLPDLTVKLELKAEKHEDSYGVLPRYTVTNNGIAAAKNFKVELWQLSRSSSQARIKSTWWCSNTISSLGSKQSWTFDYNPINTAVWRSGNGNQVGFRVVADPEKKVAEKKEDNNTAQKMWPIEFHVLKKN